MFGNNLYDFLWSCMYCFRGGACEGCYPGLVSGSRYYSRVCLEVVMVVFWAFVIAVVFFGSDFDC